MVTIFSTDSYKTEKVFIYNFIYIYIYIYTHTYEKMVMIYPLNKTIKTILQDST